VRANPDVAIVNIGVVTEDKELERAQQQNAATTSSVINSLRAAGIKDADIQTVTYSVNPQAEGTTPIQPGELEIEASVNAVFAYH